MLGRRFGGSEEGWDEEIDECWLGGGLVWKDVGWEEGTET